MTEEENLKPTLLRTNEGLLMDDDDQKESLLHPYQAIAHQCKFNSIPMGYLDTNDQQGKLQMTVEEMVMTFLFDDRKVHQHIRKLTAEELLTLPEVEITSPTP